MRKNSAGFALSLALLGASAVPALAGNGKIINDTSFYSGPQDSYSSVGSFASGEVLVIYGCDASFEWCDVGQSQRRGWVDSENLAVIRGANFIPVRKLAPFVGVRVLTYNEQEYQARHYGGEAPADVAQTPAETVIASADTGQGGPAAANGAYNEAMTLVARALQTPSSESADEPAEQASVDQQVETETPPVAEPAKKPEKRKNWKGKALSDASIRSGPASKYPRIATIAAGRGIVIHGCTSRYRWCDISAGEKRGWVYAPLLGATTGGKTSSVVKVGKKLGIAILKFDLKAYHSRHYAGESWQNDANGPDAVKLRGERKRSQSSKSAGNQAKAATARVVRIPGPSRSKLPASANALQPTEGEGEQAEATADGETIELAQPTGIKRFIPKFLR